MGRSRYLCAMAIPREISQQFRTGHSVLWSRPEAPLLITSLPHANAPQNRQMSVALAVAEVGLLTGYVQEISDLMWDVLEHTEKELWLQVPGGRNVPDWVLNADGSINLVWARTGPLQQLIHPTGKPGILWWLPSSEAEQKQVLAPVENVVTLPPAKEKAPAVRHMRLEPSGSVQILK